MQEGSILYAWQGSEYASALQVKGLTDNSETKLKIRAYQKRENWHLTCNYYKVSQWATL